MRHKEFTIVLLDDEAKIHVWFDVDKGKVVRFAINLVWIESEKTNDVYRIDTCHGFLHEQKFWISNEPKRLDMNVHNAFNEKLKEVKENYSKMIRALKRSKRKFK